MQIPKFHETFNPILKILEDGEIIHHRTMAQRVIDNFYSNLPKELLEQKTKSGDILIMNRIAWGKSYLKKGGFIIFPKRGMVQITKKGKNALNQDLKLSDIENSENYLKFYSAEKSKDDTKEITSATPQDLIDTGVNKIELEVKEELLEKLKSIDPFYFERVILILLKKMGYGAVIETSKTGDGGIDGIINEDQLGLN
jgi:restriction system protein